MAVADAGLSLVSLALSVVDVVVMWGSEASSASPSLDEPEEDEDDSSGECPSADL